MPGTTQDRERIDAMCRKLDTYIPNSLSLYFWPMPLLERIVELLDAHDERLRDIEGRMGE
jgi:hypothetical protein